MFNVLKVFEDNGKTFSFRHGKTRTYRSTAYAPRAKKTGYVKVNNDLRDSVNLLLSEFPFTANPKTQGNSESREDFIKSLYVYDMLEMVDLLEINDSKISINYISNVVKDMLINSVQGTADGKSFEKSLEPFMLLFNDVEKCEIISGSADTDLLCTITSNNPNLQKFKMNVEAKKRANVTEVLNKRRLESHMRKNNSEYCIVVSPKFSRGAVLDIADSNIVTISAEVLGEFVLRSCLSSPEGKAEYSLLHNIIKDSLGSDITAKVNNLIVDLFSF